MLKRISITPDLGETLESYFVPVHLSEAEIKLAVKYGTKIFELGISRDTSDGRSTLEDEIAWVKSEMAVAQWAGIEYEDPCDKRTFVPDVTYFDVRFVSDPTYNLVVKEKDPSGRIVISVAEKDNNYLLRGWEYVDHMRYWMEKILTKDKTLYDKNGAFKYSWRLLKPMYLLSRDSEDYKLCANCNGRGFSNDGKVCKFCPLGKTLESNPSALSQLIKFCTRFNVQA